MQKKLKDYVKFYIGQRIRSYWMGRPEVDFIYGIVGDRVITSFIDDEMTGSIDLRYKPQSVTAPKLLLRPISDITNIEVNHILKMFSELMLPDTVEERYQFALYLSSNKELKPDLFYFLTSKGFDVFGLIECGLAIPFYKKKQ